VVRVPVADYGPPFSVTVAGANDRPTLPLAPGLVSVTAPVNPLIGVTAVVNDTDPPACTLSPCAGLAADRC